MRAFQTITTLALAMLCLPSTGHTQHERIFSHLKHEDLVRISMLPVADGSLVYTGYLLLWDADMTEWDSTSFVTATRDSDESQEQFILEESTYDEELQVWEPQSRIIYYGYNEPPDGEDLYLTFHVADSIRLESFNEETGSYEPWILFYFFPNDQGLVERIEWIINGVSSATTRNYYDDENRLTAHVNRFNEYDLTGDSLAFTYGPQLTRTIWYQWDDYFGGLYGVEVTDYSYADPEHVAYKIVTEYTDSLITLFSIDSIAYTYFSGEGNYLEANYAWNQNTQTYFWDFHTLYSNLDDTLRTERRSDQGPHGIYVSWLTERRYDAEGRVVQILQQVDSAFTDQLINWRLEIYQYPQTTSTRAPANIDFKGLTYSIEGNRLKVQFRQSLQATLALVSASGQICQQTSFNDASVSVGIGELPAGIYYLHVFNGKASYAAGLLLGLR
ncbi:MAG: hypothetical protein R3301_08465 [Saprospiraceae bacterium]|nr:hypothetical protein [Saprospiraceae bacterium]